MRMKFYCLSVIVCKSYISIIAIVFKKSVTFFDTIIRTYGQPYSQVPLYCYYGYMYMYVCNAFFIQDNFIIFLTI